jgi:ribonucleoside-triphosphate reductase (formate)
MFKFKNKETKIEKKEINKNLVDSKKIVEEYLHKSNWRLKENANMSYAVQGLNNYISSKVSAKYWLDQYPEPIADAHRN